MASVSPYIPASGEQITHFKIEISSLQPGAYIQYAGIQVKLKDGVTASTVQNCMTGTAAPSATFDNSLACYGLTVQPLDPYSTLAINKWLTQSPNSQYATFYGTPQNIGTTVWSTLYVQNRSGGQPLANPVVMDLLPAGLDYDGAIQYGTSSCSFAQANTTEIIPNYNGTGRTLVRLKWTTPMPSGCDMWVSIRTKLTNLAPGGTTSGTDWAAQLGDPYSVLTKGVKNSAFFTGSSTAQCFRESIYNPLSYYNTADVHDLNGDGVTSNTLCFASANVNTTSVAQLESVKWVKGECDTDYTKHPQTGKTMPGGLANYKLIVKNNGNVSATSIEILDMLPYIGDIGVKDVTPRLTEWRPNLVTPLVTPTGITVYYTTVQNPCRTAYVAGGPAGCNPPNWTTVLPADPTTIQGLKFDFGTKVLNPGDEIELKWDMRAPANAPTAGEIAWNSFGFKAIRADNNDPFLPAEPNKVGIELKPLVPGAYGDFVWIDTNKDGIQDAGELGIDGVRVELHRDNGDGIADPKNDELVTFTSTGNGGKYLFPNLKPGNYFAVFFVPPGYSTSPANAGSNTALNSDGTPALCNGNRVTITPITAIDANETDLTWDQGLFVDKAALGNYVWFDENQNNIQDESTTNGLNGVLVCLYRDVNNNNTAEPDAADGTTVATFITTNDVYGRPGYYLFENLDPGKYFVKFKLASGQTFTPGSGTANGSSDQTDSDPTAAGVTEVTDLTAGEVDLSWDAGVIIQTGVYKLGNLVWDDLNNNGKVDGTETGLNGVTVNLYEDRNNNNKPDPSEYIKATVTATLNGIAGTYYFDRLPAGNYIVQIPDANFTGPLKDYATSTGNDPAPDPDDNIENDDNGSLVAGCGVISKPITLSATAEPLDAGKTNLTVDFGFYKCAKPTYTASIVQPTCAGGKGSISISSSAAVGDKVGYTIGSSFTGTYASATAIGSLTNRVIVGNIAAPASDETYTVRIYNGEEACYKDFVFTFPKLTCATCALTATATPGACNTATNQYTVSGTISLTANTAGGTATITDGASSTTVAVAANATSVAYSLTGLASGTGSHTVTVSLSGCGTASTTYSAPASCSVVSSSGCTGFVFFDGNNNGTKDASEVGFGGVTVKAYNASNALAATAISAFTPVPGQYSLGGLTNGQAYRIEFTVPAGYNDGAFGTTPQTSVQFVQAGATCPNFGVYVPGVCLPDKTIRVIAGCAAIPLINSTISLVSWDYTSCVTTLARYAATPHTDDANASQVGIPLGLGLLNKDKKNRVIFSTIASPNTGVFPESPDGKDALYIADYTGTGNGFQSVKLLTKLTGLTPSINISNQNPVGTTTNFGEYGLGGVDISEDNKTLYVVNMGNGKLVKLDISGIDYATVPTGGYTNLPVSEITIPTSTAGCTNGVFRPTGIEVYAGSVYVAGICDASTSSTNTNSDLRLKVLKMNPSNNNFTVVMNEDLSAIIAGSISSNTGQGPNPGWKQTKWKDTFVGGWGESNGEVQPVAVDMDFDDTGSIILGVTNRKVYSNSSVSETGYLVRTYRQADGSFALENAGVSGPYTSSARINPSLQPGNFNNTPAGPGQKWFFEQGMVNSIPNDGHPNLFSGGVFIVPGKQEVLAGFVDPLEFQQTGARYFDWTTGITKCGTSVTGFKVFAITGTQGVCDATPVEIGDRVWRDNNLNGIQDADEPGLKGVTVAVCEPGTTTPIATAITDANGYYIFSTAAGTSTTNIKYGVALNFNAPYDVKVTGLGSDPSVSGLTLTGMSPVLGETASTTNTGATPANSDAFLVGGLPTIRVVVGSAGQNNHTYDFGFGVSSCTMTATATPGICNSATNQYTVSGTVNLTGTTGGTATITDGTRSITVTVAASATSVAYSLTGLTSGTGSHTVTVSLAGCGTASVTYAAPASCLSATLCPGPTYLVLSDLRTGLHVFDFPTPNQELQSCLNLGAKQGEGIAIDYANNKTYFSILNEGIVQFDGITKTVSSSFSTTNQSSAILDVALSLDNQSLFVGSVNGLLKYTTTGTLLGTVSPNSRFMWGVAVNPLNGRVFTTEGYFAFGSGMSYISEIDPTSLSVISSSVVSTTTNNYLGGFVGLSFALDGTFWVVKRSSTANSSDLVQNYSTSGTLLKSCPVGNNNPGGDPNSANPSAAWKVIMGPDNNLYVSSSDAQACVWKVNPSSCASSVFVPQPGTGFSKGIAFACTDQVCIQSPCSLSITTTALASGTVGVAYSQTIAISGAVGSPIFTMTGNLPQGLNLNAATGIISGTPTSATTASFTIAVTDGKNCSAVVPLTITVVCPTVTASILGNLSICQGQATTLTASGGSTYRWSTGALTASISVSAAGPYSVTATTTPGCAATATASVVVNPLPSLTVGSATICVGQSATLVASGASTYNWSNGSAMASIVVSPTVTTTYSVTGFTAQGCSATAIGTVTVNGQPQINGINQGVCVGNTASLTVTATNSGAGILEYSLNGGVFQSNNVFSINATNSVTAVVVVRTQGSSCTAIESVVVNCACQTPVSLTFVPTTLQTCAGSPVSFTVGVSGATSATLTSSGSGTLSQNTITSSGIQTVSYRPSLADATAGSVTLTLTSADPDGVGACVADQVTRMLAINAVPSVSATSASICAGGVAVLMASGAATYRWNTGATTQSISVSVAGAYSVTGLTAQGCSNVASGSLTVFATPTLSPASLPTATVGTPYNQTLTGSGGRGLSLTAAGVLSGVPTSPAPASFTVLMTDANGCSAVQPYSVGANQPSLTVSVGAPVCSTVTNNYTASGTVSLTNAPAGTLTLTDNGTVVATLSVTAGQTSASFPVSGVSNATSHTVVATLSNGVTVTASTTYQAPASCTFCSLSITTTALASGTVGLAYSQTISATGGTGSLTFVVSAGSLPAGLNLSAAGVLSGTPTAAATTSFTVRVTDGKNCSAVVPLTLTMVCPAFTITATSATICVGQTATLVASGAASYAWSQGGMTASIVVSPTATQIYSVTGVSGAGCPASTTARVTVNGQPQINSISQSTACIGNTANLTVNATTSGSGILEYSLNGGAFQTSNSFTLNAATSTTATIVVRTQGSSCSATESVVVNCACQTPVSLTFVPTTLQTCAGSPVSFTAGVAGATSATLTTSGSGVFSQAVISGRTTVSYQPSLADATAGSVTLTLTSADPDGVGACVADQLTRMLTISPAPSVSVNSVSVCAGEMTMLTAGGAATYRWNTGATTQSISVSVAGTYSVTGLSAQGCSATAAGSVSVQSIPVITVKRRLFIRNNMALLSVSGCTGGTVNWSNGATNQSSITVAAPFGIRQSYTALCTTATGCTALATVSINREPGGDDELQVTNAVVCEGSPTTLTATGCQNGTLLWSTNATTSSIVVPGQTASYSVTCMDSKGDLVAVGSVSAVSTPSLTLTASPSQTVTVGSNVTLTVTGCSSGTVNWSTGIMGQLSAVVSPTLGSSTYSLTCTITGGCQSTTQITLVGTQSAQPQLVLKKMVSKNRAKLGEVVSYTVTLANTGAASATGVVVSDTYTAGISLVPGSVSVSSGSFTVGLSGGQWAISSLPAGSTATLTFSASLTSEGISFNTASIESQTVTVCTSVPVQVCKNEPFAFQLGAPVGYNRYQWYLTTPNGTSLVSDVTATSANASTAGNYTATVAGEYTVRINEGVQGVCPDGSCCPAIIEEVSVPSYTVVSRQPTCVGSSPQANGQLTLTNLMSGTSTAQYVYQISLGSSFSASTAQPVTPTAVPSNGVIGSNLAQGTYTVRVWVLLNGEPSCPRDVTVSLVANCACPEEICLPVVIKKTKSQGRTLP
jgi:uncharacterized repeat protein (TIGR01451 family)